jgi:hypothetical protein
MKEKKLESHITFPFNFRQKTTVNNNETGLTKKT